MQLTLGEIAQLVNGRLQGDAQIVIHGANIIRDAVEGDITLADKAKLADELDGCAASAVIVSGDFQPENLPSITVDDVHSAFAKIVEQFRPQHDNTFSGISPAAIVSSTAKLGEGVSIHPNAVIGEGVEIGAGTEIHSGVQVMAGCKIGEGVVLFPNVVLYENTVVGSRVIVHAGAVVGAYGFGYQTAGGRHELSAQLGNVEICDDVEIGAGTTIDRGTYGATVIGEGTKIDNQVMIAHNCRIGQHNLICSQVGIAGSATTGDYVVLAGQVGIRDHVNLGDQVMLGAQAGVMNDLLDAGTYLGSPAMQDREQMLIIASLRKLPALRKQVKALQQTIDKLQTPPETSERQEAA